MRQFYLPAFFLIAATSLHAEDANPVAPSLPAVACEFQTVIEEPNTEPRSRTWRLWRSENEVETQEVGQSDAEAWERNPRGQITYYRVFHPEKRVIEYLPTDLAMKKNKPQWDRLCSIVSPEVLSQLTKAGEEQVLGRRAVRYEGDVAGARMIVLWLEAEQLPALLKETRGDHVSTITLKELHELGAAPWPHGLRKDYATIDFADLGDKESDPGLKEMLKRVGRSHGEHGHIH
jgi:hypothetical protein